MKRFIFWSCLFRPLNASHAWIPVYFPKCGEISAAISLNKVPETFTLFGPGYPGICYVTQVGLGFTEICICLSSPEIKDVCHHVQQFP